MTRTPFRVLSALIIVLVACVWARALVLVLGLHLDADEHLLTWLLPVAASLLVVAAWIVMHGARRRAIAAADLTEWRLAAFTSASNEAAWETTVDGVITFAGPHVLDILGYQPAEVIGLNSSQLHGRGQAERVQALRMRAITATNGWTNEPVTYVTKAGEVKTLSTSALLRHSRDGVPTGFTGLLREIGVEGRRQQSHRAIAARIQRVLDSADLQIALQPIVDAATGDLLGVEALSRFPSTPHLSPDRWFRQAAHVGLGADLELLAITVALARTAHLPDGVYLSINTSPATLATGRVHHAVQHSPWPPAQIVVEITEHVSVDNYEFLRPAIADLRSLGVRIAVDDAGSGYASFRHILELQPDYIKLDRQIIDRIDHDPAKRALVIALVSFAREVGATLIAEGVETAGELDTITRLGVHAAQGYHIGRPALA
jgi:PAS domain S-box-containing protein